jgi:GcrA cell cycle regulator
VIGKARRLGLDQRTSSPTRYQSSLPKKPQARPKLARPKLVQKQFIEPPIPTVEPQLSERVHLLQLQPHHCRWVMGEAAELMFCGLPKYEDRPYCRMHAQRAYQPARTRV